MRRITMKEVTLSNGETAAYRERDGGERKVLLIHGNMTSSKHWDLVYENMDPLFKVYAVDLRGFGNSSYHRPIQSIKDFSDDVKLFCDAIGLRDFVLVGWSMGGTVSMQFAADNPGYCHKLILLASASTRGYPFYGKTSNDQEVHRVKSFEETKMDLIRTIPVQSAYEGGDTEFLQLVWNASIYTQNKPAPERYNEYLHDMLTQRNLAEVYYALNIFNISRQHNGLAEGDGKAEQINVPVLVLHGDRDLVITKEMNDELLMDLGENGKFVELKDCGHSPLIDDLDQLLKAITEFLI